MSRSTTPLDDRLYSYFLEVSIRDDDVHRRLREETSELENAQMQISAEQGQFMTLLVAATNARLALEIGTFTGYSALCIAEGLPDDGRLIACDIDEEWPSFGRRYWAEAGVGHKIEFRAGPAADTMTQLIDEGMEGDFDFVFIDADKRGLEEYYEKALRLVRVGGIIAVDNTLWSGQVADPDVSDEDTKAIRGFNATVIDDLRVQISLVPIGDGLTLLRRLR
ncbi:MAG: O-methyltransferase [Longimicrobiales bacterium]